MDGGGVDDGDGGALGGREREEVGDSAEGGEAGDAGAYLGGEEEEEEEEEEGRNELGKQMRRHRKYRIE